MLYCPRHDERGQKTSLAVQEHQKVNKMRILLVEDNVANIEAAKVQLEGHDLTIVSGYDQALLALESSVGYNDQEAVISELEFQAELLGWKYDWQSSWGDKKVFINPQGESLSGDDLPSWIQAHLERIIEITRNERFDVVLTDVMFPKGGVRTMSDKGKELVAKQGEMPYGPMVMLHALQNGVKRIGILTAGNHHHDPFVQAFDCLQGFTADDVKVVCSNECHNYVLFVDRNYKEVPCPIDYESKIRNGDILQVKNWAYLLEQVMA